jgi:membrane protease YdiL (CAAX protease family)
MKKIINDHQLAFFFLLSYLLSWSPSPLINGAILPQGPAIAALITIALTSGRPGFGDYWRSLSLWRARWWYLVGPLVVVGYGAAAFALNQLIGATPVVAPQAPAIGTLVGLLLFGGQWEELGWTAYALPRLQQRFTGRPNAPLVAVLVLGAFRALWHLPLFLQGKVYWFDIFLFSFVFQIIIAWIYGRSRRSVLAVMAFHFASNVMGAVMYPVFAGHDRVMFYALFMGVAGVLALVLIVTSAFDPAGEAREATA